jgi:opine dehydrogenase
MSIGIVGAGSIGLALAADLAVRGFEVTTLVEEDAPLRARLRIAGTVSLSGNLGAARVPMPRLTADPAGLADCELVFVATTADRHADVARAAGRRLGAGQTVVLTTGYVGGAAAFDAALPASGPAGGPLVLALNTAPYLSYAPGDGRVHVAAAKSWMEVSSLDAEGAARGSAALVAVLSACRPAEHQLASSLNNPNPAAHVPVLLLHAERARQEAAGLVPPQGAFHLGDFGSASAEALRTALEEERRLTMEAMGLGSRFMSRQTFAARAYGPASREPDPPRLGPAFQARFASEDVPCGLLPVEALARRHGVAVPRTTALIDLIATLAGEDLRSRARPLDDILAPADTGDPGQVPAAPRGGG